MPLDHTSPGLDALLIATVLQMELSPRDNRVAEKRYKLIPSHLEREGSPLRLHVDNALVYAQGSRAIGTTIVHGADEDRFDLDAILEFDTPFGWTPRRVLDELFEAFQGFPDVQEIERCTRCIQLRFAFMHLDVTPMDPALKPRPERVGDICHSPDEGHDERHAVNPYGFAEWFKGQISLPSQMFQAQVRSLRNQLEMKDRLRPGIIVADADIDELPETVDPIQDAPQVLALKLMKRYLNLRYANRNEKRPISVYLSKVAAQIPPTSFGVCAQLENLAAALDRRMKFALETGRRPEERNPAFHQENFNDRWPQNTRLMEMFREDLRHLLAELQRARTSDVAQIQKIFDGLFGERISGNAVRTYMDSLSNSPQKSTYELGKGFVAAPALLTPGAARAAATSKAPVHNFHAGELRKK